MPLAIERPCGGGTGRHCVFVGTIVNEEWIGRRTIGDSQCRHSVEKKGRGEGEEARGSEVVVICFRGALTGPAPSEQRHVPSLRPSPGPEDVRAVSELPGARVHAELVIGLSEIAPCREAGAQRVSLAANNQTALHALTNEPLANK
jgi:hypothetical protein